ncbi:MAG TPA: HlyD family secretion protein [Rhizobiales bacterium]|nr:HlyD family secretion protein [Hyphomicrobiales bacterium]
MGRKILPVLILAAIAGFAGYEYYTAHQDIQHSGEYQGYLEGEFVLVGAEQSGRIAREDVAEGAAVQKDAILFELDRDLAKASLAERRAAVERARAQLDNLKAAQQRPEQIDVLQATQRRFQADLDLAVLELRRLEDLYRRKVASKEQFDRARTQFLKAKAARDEIRRQIVLARLPARQRLVAAAEAELRIARAALRQAQIVVEKLTIRAPVSGEVQEVFFRAGEVISAGQPVFSILPAGKLKALFFVPEARRALLQKGTRVEILCDNCPDHLTARVSFIAQEAEYTPPVIFGPVERAKLVFRVEARLEASGAALSPGQPVTVRRASFGDEQK